MRVSRSPRPRLTPECAEHPVDGGDVGAAPDPELPGHAVGPGFLGDRLEHLLDLVDGVGLVRRAHLRLHSWRGGTAQSDLPRRTATRYISTVNRPFSNGRNVMPMPLREVLRDPTVVAAEPARARGSDPAGAPRHLGPHERGARHRHAAARRRAAARGRGQPGDGVARATGDLHPGPRRASGRGHRHRDGRAAAHRARGDGHGGRATAPAPDRAAPRRAVRRGDAVHQRDAGQRVGPPSPARRPASRTLWRRAWPTVPRWAG